VGSVLVSFPLCGGIQVFRKKTRGRKSGPLSDLFLSTLLTEFQYSAYIERFVSLTKELSLLT
ncbi:hypothetical protein, partial [Thalassobacillus sp. B23F22_16]|uniref:hypothetical protein n=1 Tax=Thalassobacillus sp. B23F22_16 TaxID=3459513 RepID=UPI00373ED9D7